MRLKNLRLKLKAIKLRKFLVGKLRRKSRKVENGKRDSWMIHVSHGYHVVELEKPLTSVGQFSSIVVQREQKQESELWLFGAFDDDEIGEGVTKYMQSHFFNNIPRESRMGKKCKEVMKRAYLNAKAKPMDRYDSEETTGKLGSASAMVINGEKLVLANMGGYRAVICRDGEAYQICRKKQQSATRNWPLEFLSGALRVPNIHKIGSAFSTAYGRKSSKDVVVGSERIDSETEFVILASTGVWEVMRHQEAVNLIRHLEDPQAAAECLATEALIRMTRSNISCLIIRFD